MDTLPPIPVPSSPARMRKRARTARQESSPERRQIRLRPTPIWKRTFDVAVSLFLLGMLAPLFLVIAAYIKIVSPRGPVLFSQWRAGAGGRYFQILKFRTMEYDGSDAATAEHRRYIASLAETGQPLAKPDRDRPLLPGSLLLRRFSLDELPQLWNILRGEMSVVGPRPDVLEFDDYTPQQLQRFEVAPGMTGLWQVSGKNRLSFDEMIRLDLEYVEQRSLRLDAWILLLTLPLILGTNGR